MAWNAVCMRPGLMSMGRALSFLLILHLNLTVVVQGMGQAILHGFAFTVEHQ